MAPRDTSLYIATTEWAKRNETLIRAGVAECIGVILFCVVTFGFYVTESVILANSILIGFTHAAVMQGLLLASGGHINPAITLGFVILRWLGLYPALVYVSGQLIGSIGCIPILKWLWRGNVTVDEEYQPPAKTTGMMGVTNVENAPPNNIFPPPPNTMNQWQNISLKGLTTPLQGFWIEFFIGFIIMLVYCTVHDPTRPTGKILGSFAVGAAVTGGHLLAYNFTGGGINPVRIFTLAYCEDEYMKYMLYFLGPTLGCVMAAFLYKEFSKPGPGIPGTQVF